MFVKTFRRKKHVFSSKWAINEDELRVRRGWAEVELRFDLRFDFFEMNFENGGRSMASDVTDKHRFFRHNSEITGKTFPDYAPYTIQRAEVYSWTVIPAQSTGFYIPNNNHLQHTKKRDSPFSRRSCHSTYQYLPKTSITERLTSVQFSSTLCVGFV